MFSQSSIYRSLLLLALALGVTTPSPAAIYNWQTGNVIPGTETITPGPGLNLSYWRTDAHNLKYASLNGMNLTTSDLRYSWLTYADFGGADLTSANLFYATVTSANFTDAVVKGIDLGRAKGFTKEQLYSTASYKSKDLGSIWLDPHNLSGWDFHGQNLAHAYFARTTLTGADFAEATLRGANLEYAILVGADFTGANLIELSFGGPHERGMPLTSLTGANFTRADMRGIDRTLVTGTPIVHNTIGIGGGIWIDSSTPGLQLASGEELVIRNYSIPINIGGSWTMAQSAAMKMVLEGNWQSIITVNAATDLGGTLNLSFADGIDPRTLIGTEFGLFNWNGRLTAGDHFDSIVSLPGAEWDTSRLYTDGIVTLTVPEPMTIGLLALGCLLMPGQGRAG